MSNFSSPRFLKLICSDDADYLQENYPNAFLLLIQIAKTARRTPNGLDGLEVGDAIVGEIETSKKAGLTTKQYRNALEKLEELGFIETVFNPKIQKPQKRAIKRAIKSKIVNLKDTRVLDINSNIKGDQKGDLGANKGRTEGDKQERIRMNKKEKEEQQAREAREAAKPPDVISLNKRVKIEEEHLCSSTCFSETTSDNICLISNYEEVTENKKNICQEKKRSTQSNPKISFRDNVLLTQLEYDKLLATHGNPALDWMLDKLSNQKHSRGIKYKSDYHAILNWVVDAYTQSIQLNKSSSSNSLEENRKLAKSVFHDFQSSHYKIEILSKGVEFVPNSGQKSPEFLDFSSNGFKDQLNSILEKLKFSRKVCLVKLKHG